MQLYGNLDSILFKIGDNFKEIKDGFKRSIKYLDEKLREIGYKTHEKLRETKNTISEYMPAIIASLPYSAKTPILAGLYIKNSYKGRKGKLLGYTLIGIGAAAFGLFLLSGIHGLLSPNNENIYYAGSHDGYQAFVPHDTINYNGHTDPKGDLILDNGNVIHNAIWDGKYSDTIINNHNQIIKLNNDFVGKINPVNNQRYVPLHDLYVIKGQVPIKQITIDGQTYYLIDANKINPANIAGFYTYKEWINNFVAAINTPGTYAAGLQGNSPVFKWTNTTGTVAYQTMVYGRYGPFDGGVVLVLPNKTIIPYGTTLYPSGPSLNNYIRMQQIYNPSS